MNLLYYIASQARIIVEAFEFWEFASRSTWTVDYAAVHN